MNSRESFNNITKWIQEVRKNCEGQVQMVLVGSKADLVDEYSL